jgi:hypothetical protein
MSKQARVRIVGAIPARPSAPPSEAMKESLVRLEKQVRAIKATGKTARRSA